MRRKRTVIQRIQAIAEKQRQQLCNSPEPFDSEALTLLLKDVWGINDENCSDLVADVKEIVDTAKRLPSHIRDEQIAKKLLENECTLAFVLAIGKATVLRIMLDVREEISSEESCNLMIVAVRLTHLSNLKVLVRYGPGAVERRQVFTKIMFELLNESQADVNNVKRYVDQLHKARVIDEFTLQFLKDTFEKGKARVIEMLLDSEIYVYVRERIGEDLVARLFGNVNVNAAKVLRGRGFNENAKCDGKSALHYAVSSRSDNNVRFLLGSGADPNVTDCKGMTPLFVSVDAECATLLLHNDADVQVMANNGETVLDVFTNANLLEIMLAHIALIEAQGTKIRPEITDRLDSDNFIDFYDTACIQLENMKYYSIKRNFTLWNALLHKSERICPFINSQETIGNLVDECCNLPIHSYYVSILETNFNRALICNSLRCRVLQKLLNIFSKFHMYEMLVDKIVDYLSFTDFLLYT